MKGYLINKRYASHTHTLITRTYTCLLVTPKYLFGVFPIFPIANRIKNVEKLEARNFNSFFLLHLGYL